MVLFTKYKAVGALVLTVALGTVPLMVEHKPDAVLSGLAEWLWLIYPVIVALLLYIGATFGYSRGQRDQPAPPQPVEQPADPAGRTLNDLLYAARTITNALMEDGELRVGAIEAQLPRLERQHRAWHGHMRLQARDDFLSTVRRAMQARQLKVGWMAGPGPHYGAFPGDQKAAFHAELKERRDFLVMLLETQKMMDSRRGDEPELVEG